MKLSQRGMGRPSLGGLLATRQGSLTLAILCAAAAAGVLLVALSSYKHGVQTAAKAAQATVLVATGAVPKGTPGDLVASEKLYKSTPIVSSQLAAGAISDSSVLQGKIAQSSILPGQQLTTADFTATPAVTGLLTPSQRAVSVPTDGVHGDLGVLEPGDRVDLYASVARNNITTISLLAADVLVVKTPTSGLAGAAAVAASTTSSGSAQAALVFAVSIPTVAPLELAADAGKVWVAVRPANATRPQGGVTTLASVFARSYSAANSGSSAANGNTNPAGTHP